MRCQNPLEWAQEVLMTLSVTVYTRRHWCWHVAGYGNSLDNATFDIVIVGVGHLFGILLNSTKVANNNRGLPRSGTLMLGLCKEIKCYFC